MAIMMKSAHRAEGAEQPSIKLGMFRIRIPFVHAPWELPEMIQAMVVFVTGVSAVAYLQDIFGLPFSVALSIVCIHELLYVFQNIVGDPIVGGWITPAIPLVTTWLLSFQNTTERIQALVMLQLILGLLYLILGVTGLASRLVHQVPVSVKAGILIGAGFSAVIGKYGFAAAENGGVGFYASPVSFSVGVLAALFLLFSLGFNRQKNKPGHKFIKFLAKCGFVPALLLAYIVGMLAGEISSDAGERAVRRHPLQPHSRTEICAGELLPDCIGPALLARDLLCGGDGGGGLYHFLWRYRHLGTEFLEDAKQYRPDENVNVNPNLTNICCGVRNILQSLFFPTVTLSGPLWSAMMVTICERYKTGKENMYSFFGGCITFNVAKWICCLILPLVALIRPILPLSMSLTLMIQAFGCFYVALGLCKNNTQRGVAGLIGGVLAITNPQTGLLVGIVISFICEWLLTKDFGGKKVSETAETVEAVREKRHNTAPRCGQIGIRGAFVMEKSGE